MGNCSLKGFSGQCPNMIKVLKVSGEIIELKGPKLVKDVLSVYTGHGIFRQVNASSQLSDYEYLVGGQFYYLLPLKMMQTFSDTEVTSQFANMGCEEMENVSPERSRSARLDSVGDKADVAALQVLPSLGNGVWRVKLVINTKDLEEILSEKENTEALIEKMRMAAASSTSNFSPRRSKNSRGVARRPAFSNAL